MKESANKTRALGMLVMIALIISSPASSQHGVARYNTNGSLDATFDGNGRISTDLFTGNGSFSGGSDIAIQ